MTVIVGVGVMAMLQLLAAGTISNSKSTELTTAVNLASNINELTIRRTYSQLRTVGSGTGTTYEPPIDGRGVAMAGYPGWAQIVTVKYVNPNNVTFVVPDSQIEPVSRVTVDIRRNGKVVHTTSWLMSAGVWPP